MLSVFDILKYMRQHVPDSTSWKFALDQLNQNLSSKTAFCLHQEVPHYEPLDLCTLVTALKRNTSIRTLDFSKKNKNNNDINHIDDYVNEDNICVLTQYLSSNTTVKHLNLSNNAINDTGGIILFKALVNNTVLDTVVLSNTNIGNLTLKALTDTLKSNQNFKNIDVSHNASITCSGVLSLSGILGCILPSLLNLENTQVLPITIERLTSAFERYQALKIILSLKTEFCLPRDFPEYEAMDFSILIHALKTNTSITSLDLSTKETVEEYIDQDNITSLAEYLSLNKTLLSLNLQGNTLNDAGGVILFKGLRYNEHLKTVILSKTQIGDDTMVALADILKYPNPLKYIDASNNPFITCFGAISVSGAISGTLGYLPPSLLNLKNTSVSALTLKKLYQEFSVSQALKQFEALKAAFIEYSHAEALGVEILDLKERFAPQMIPPVISMPILTKQKSLEIPQKKVNHFHRPVNMEVLRRRTSL